MRSVKQKRAAAALVRELGFAFTVNVVLHKANLDRIGEIIDLAAEMGADRLELANTQYYGWGLRQSRRAHADPRAGGRAFEIAERAKQAYRGGMQILFVLPDYYEKYPKACYGGWGKRLPRRGARRHGPALPRRHEHHHAFPSQRARTFHASGSGRSRRCSTRSVATAG